MVDVTVDVYLIFAVVMTSNHSMVSVDVPSCNLSLWFYEKQASRLRMGHSSTIKVEGESIPS